jgi:hypothetical protein
MTCSAVEDQGQVRHGHAALPASAMHCIPLACGYTRPYRCLSLFLPLSKLVTLGVLSHGVANSTAVQLQLEKELPRSLI